MGLGWTGCGLLVFGFRVSGFGFCTGDAFDADDFTPARRQMGMGNCCWRGSDLPFGVAFDDGDGAGRRQSPFGAAFLVPVRPLLRRYSSRVVCGRNVFGE